MLKNPHFRTIIQQVFLLLGFVSGISSSTHAADPVRIFFVGNSLTYGNDMQDTVAAILASTGKFSPLVGGSLRGNFQLNDHADSEAALASLRQGAADGQPWDVMVLQEQSLLSAFSDSHAESAEKMQRGMVRLVKAGHETNPNMLFITFEVWARHPSLWTSPDPDQRAVAKATGVTSNAAQNNIRRALINAMLVTRRTVPGARILACPVGEFWSLALTKLPRIKLHDGDGNHAATAGSLLTAYALAGVIGGRVILETSSWRGDIPVDEANALRQLLLENPDVFRQAATW